MELTTKRIIKELLEKYNAKPEKYLGQHFILSKKALTLILAAAEIKKTDTIIEIGPGLGTLTQELAKTGDRVLAIEKDHLMISILKETLADYKNVKIIKADAREVRLRGFLKSDFGRPEKYKIVANLPYNVATFLIRSWLETECPPELMVLMIQKEVARRIVAKPPHSNLLALSVQFYADAKIIGYVSKEIFWPRPKVDAAIIKIVPKKMTVFARSLDNSHFFKIVKAGFSSPRKQLAGNLSKKLNIPREKLILTFKNLDISKTARAENLSLKQWTSLVISLHLQLIHN